MSPKNDVALTCYIFLFKLWTLAFVNDFISVEAICNANYFWYTQLCTFLNKWASRIHVIGL
jgi:hypothetical protein